MHLRKASLLSRQWGPPHNAIKHKALILASTAACLINKQGKRINWEVYSDRFKKWLHGKQRDLQYGGHWLAALSVISGEQSNKETAIKKLTLPKTAEIELAKETEHSVLNFAEGLRTYLVASCENNYYSIDIDGVKAGLNIIQFGYFSALPKSEGSHTFRLLLIFLDLINIYNYFQISATNPDSTVENSKTIINLIKDKIKQCKELIKNPKIIRLIKRFEAYAEDEKSVWHLENSYLYPIDILNTPPYRKFRPIILDMYKIAIEERTDYSTKSAGWMTWYRYFKYLGCLSSDSRIFDLTRRALSKTSPPTSSS